MNTPCQRWRERRDRYRPGGERIDTTRYGVEVVEQSAARAFVERNHYAGTFPAARLSVGLFRARPWVAAELVGVAVFSVPCTQAVIPRWTGQPAAHGVELGRLVLLDDVEGNGESWFLGHAFRLVREALPGAGPARGGHRPERRGHPRPHVARPHRGPTLRPPTASGPGPYQGLGMTMNHKPREGAVPVIIQFEGNTVNVWGATRFHGHYERDNSVFVLDLGPEFAAMARLGVEQGRELPEGFAVEVTDDEVRLITAFATREHDVAECGAYAELFFPGTSWPHALRLLLEGQPGVRVPEGGNGADDVMLIGDDLLVIGDHGYRRLPAARVKAVLADYHPEGLTEGEETFLAETAKGCECCPNCYGRPCGGCQQGGMCDAAACECDGEDDFDDDLDDDLNDEATTTERPFIIHDLDWCWRHNDLPAMDWVNLPAEDGRRAGTAGVCAECQQSAATLTAHDGEE